MGSDSLNAYGVSFGGGRITLELVAMAAQSSEYTENH